MTVPTITTSMQIAANIIALHFSVDPVLPSMVLQQRAACTDAEGISCTISLHYFLTTLSKLCTLLYVPSYFLCMIHVASLDMLPSKPSYWTADLQ